MKERLLQMIRRWTNARVLGLEIEGPRLNYAEVSEHDGTLILRHGGTIPIGPGGEAEALAKVASQIDPGDARIACALSSPEIIVRSFRFPRIPQKELQKAIRMEAEAAILSAHSLDEMAVDWYKTGPVSRDGIEGVLAVAPKTMLSGFMDTLRKAGLSPAIVDVKALAMWNAFWRLTPDTKKLTGPVLLVNITDDATDLIIAQGREWVFLVRNLTVGARGSSTEWISEIRDSLAYAQSRGEFKKLKAAYITGPGAQVRIAEDLTPAIDLQVRVWNPLHYLGAEQNGAGLEISDGCGLSVAVGLALRKL
jgi:Tfp pilus assembly PilM family ATPase